MNLDTYPGGREAFDKYFDLEAHGGWSVKRKPRVQIIKLVYGGTHITDHTVLQRFYDAIKDYQPIVINNDNLGGDPSPNVAKDFVIDYKNVNNEDNRCIKRRHMREGETLDFGWDIKEVMWGAHPYIWSLDKFPVAYENLFWALDHGGDVLISCSTMDCDPSLGQVKSCRIDYSHPQNGRHRESVGEGGHFRFKGRWGEPKKEAECIVM